VIQQQREISLASVHAYKPEKTHGEKNIKQNHACNLGRARLLFSSFANLPVMVNRVESNDLSIEVREEAAEKSTNQP
jgi:hypothetical protein